MISKIIHTKIHTTKIIQFSIIEIQNFVPRILAKPIVIKKYQSTPQTRGIVICKISTWPLEIGARALRNDVWLRSLCLEIHVSDNLLGLKMHAIRPFLC